MQPPTHTPIASESTIDAALIWLDRSHALVARVLDKGTMVTEVDRAFDTEEAFLLRVAREAADCDRLVVMGSDSSRISFEREYVAIHHRPDQLVDAGMELEPEPWELADRLRLLVRSPRA